MDFESVLSYSFDPRSIHCKLFINFLKIVYLLAQKNKERNFRKLYIFFLLNSTCVIKKQCINDLELINLPKQQK